MSAIAEKGGASFHGIKLLMCENPLPPLDAAITAGQAEVAHGNYYTEPYSAPLRKLISERLGVPELLIHINAGSEIILRQLFDRFGQQVHLLTPTYVLFPEVARHYTETRLLPENDFVFDLAELEIPDGTTLVVIVNPNNPNGGIFDMAPLSALLRRHPDMRFLVDEAFIGLAGESVAHLVLQYPNLLVTRTTSKAHSAGERIAAEARATVQEAGFETEAALIQTETPSQHVAEAIAREASRWSADLVVLGTHGHRGFRHLMLGSVAEQMARQSPMPILLIPPPKNSTSVG